MNYIYSMSRLSIEISPEEHQKIKALAALQGQSIKDYVLNKLLISNSADEEAAMVELEELLLTRINKSKDSPVSSKSFQQITNEVIKANKS